MAISTFINIAGYQFAPLEDLKSWRTRLLALCQREQIKGTILLSTEGINLFVAGQSESVEFLLRELRSIPGLAGFQVKESTSDHQPFNRMLVRIKKEIIAFGVPGVNPALRTSPKLKPKELKAWLDAGKPVTLLDTRNDYEVKLGTFHNALPIGIDHFRDFPAGVSRLPEALKDQPIVMFCTGGIRCEKAGPYMEMAGFKHIFQLEGGILKYFEECGGAHYDGECFVFDQRVGVDPSLQETESTQCFKCLTPLTAAEQKDSRYVPGQSCPYCFKTSAEHQAENLARRQARLKEVAHPLPGSLPYDNYRPVNVPVFCDGQTVLEFLSTILKHIPSQAWEQEIQAGLITDIERRPVRSEHRVRVGEKYLHKFPDVVEPPVNVDIQLLHEDEALIVLHKPAPLPMHPSGRFNRNTLQYLINLAYHPQRPHPAHRLDANTSGLVVLTRTRHFAGFVQPQFARGEVQKVYLAQVQGHPPEDSFFCDLPISEEPGELGSRATDLENGLPSRTEFRVLERMENGTSLLEARPLTGRTNQIRVHLWELGWPVCGDPVYLPAKKLGNVQTLGLEEPPLRLHAWKLGLFHPLTRQWMEFAAIPNWSPF